MLLKFKEMNKQDMKKKNPNLLRQPKELNQEQHH
jgi:hypothetical protein